MVQKRGVSCFFNGCSSRLANSADFPPASHFSISNPPRQCHLVLLDQALPDRASILSGVSAVPQLGPGRSYPIGRGPCARVSSPQCPSSHELWCHPLIQPSIDHPLAWWSLTRVMYQAQKYNPSRPNTPTMQHTSSADHPKLACAPTQAIRPKPESIRMSLPDRLILYIVLAPS